MNEVNKVELNEEELEEILNQLNTMSEITSLLMVSIFIILTIYLLNSYMLYKWSIKNIVKHKFKLSFIDFLMPIWKNTIYFNLIKMRSIKTYRKFIVIYILLLILGIVNIYLLSIWYLYLLYVQGRVLKVYLINKDLIFLHYFSLGLLTPFILWMER